MQQLEPEQPDIRAICNILEVPYAETVELDIDNIQEQDVISTQSLIAKKQGSAYHKGHSAYKVSQIFDLMLSNQQRQQSERLFDCIVEGLGEYQAERNRLVEVIERNKLTGIFKAFEYMTQEGNNMDKIRLARFEMVLEKTCKWLYEYKDCFQDGFAILPFLFPVVDEVNGAINKYLENPFFLKVCEVCFDGGIVAMNPNIYWLLENINGLKDEEIFYCKCKKSIYGMEMEYFASYKIRGGLIFWVLVLAAIDEEFYRNEVNMIADFACMLGFNEDMMADWIKAVKYLLDGNMFNENMDIDFKTDEAKLFFKHEEAE